MATALEYYANEMNNVILRDANGVPSVFVKHGKIMSKELDDSLPNHVHPAFIVNNVTDPALLIGKYKCCELASNGTQYSLPNKPVKASMSMDTHLAKMKAFGGNVTGLTIADHGLLVMLAHKAGKLTYGNNNYGADSRSGTKWETGKAITTDDVRIYKGWEYTALQSHTTAAELAPDIAPGYWAKGKQVGGNCYDGNHTLTGSGPIDWYLNQDYCLEADIQGNVAEQVYGFRLVNCEIQILPDNNAADPSADLSDSSSAWKAILPHANDDGYDLVAPGTEGTVHYTWADSKITLDTVEPNFDDQNRNTPFKNIAVNTTNLPYVPHILYELGLCPIAGTNVDGMLYVNFTRAERVARRGGAYTTASGAGVAYLLCSSARSSTYAYSGARPRSRLTT